MTATNHVLTGLIIGVAVHQPVVALPIALASHFVLDALPHYGNRELAGQRFKVILGTDMSVAAVLLLLICVLKPAYWHIAVACGIVAASPDLMWLPGWLRTLKRRTPHKLNGVMRFHKNIQWAERPGNYPMEILWAAACVIALAKLI